jgi:predicted amidophosphoribosyltransferase
MFCNQCGTPLQPDYNVCPRCGELIARSAGAPLPARLEHHLRTLGMVWIVAGALWLLPSFGFLTLGHARLL